MTISLSQAFANWQELVADLPKDDGPMLAESWNDYTDSLCKDGELSDLQYQYAPAYDEAMPGTGSTYDELSDDRAHIVDAMGVTLSAVFIPHSQSRNKGEKSPSLNWVVTLKLRDKEIITCDYSQGCGHTTAYKNPVRFNNPTRSLDQHTTDRNIAQECETGRVCCPGFARAQVDAPDVVDVLYSLLSDASVLDCRDFADWCGDMGMDSDSIRARNIYDACVADSLKLRAAFGEKTMGELRELFEGM